MHKNVDVDQISVILDALSATRERRREAIGDSNCPESGMTDASGVDVAIVQAGACIARHSNGLIN